MRRFSLILILAASAAAFAAGARAEDWKADAPTCSGLYGALEERKASMALMNGAVAKSNLGQIDYAARKARLAGKLTEPYTAKAYQDNFNMMLLKDSIDGTTTGMATVLTHAQQCDTTFGFSPAFAFAPKPAPAAPPPAPKPAPPPAPKPTPAKIADMECSVRYLTLAAGIPENPQAQQAFMQRANAAGGMHAQANPSLDRAKLMASIEAQAKARGEKILAKQSSAIDLITDIRACDVQYGIPPTPYPPQQK